MWETLLRPLLKLGDADNQRYMELTPSCISAFPAPSSIGYTYNWRE